MLESSCAALSVRTSFASIGVLVLKFPPAPAVITREPESVPSTTGITEGDVRSVGSMFLILVYGPLVSAQLYSVGSQGRIDKSRLISEQPGRYLGASPGRS
jgi:hypothetical protein